MSEKKTSASKPPASRGGLSALHTILDGEKPSSSGRLPAAEKPSSSSRLPTGISFPSVPSKSENMPAVPASEPHGLQKTSIPGFNGNTGHPKGGSTQSPQKGIPTSSPNMGRPTHQPQRASSDINTQAGNNNPTMMMGGSDPSGTPIRPVATDGSQPSTMAPWDRPPLGGISPNAWGPDDHFFSNL